VTCRAVKAPQLLGDALDLLQLLLQFLNPGLVFGVNRIDLARKN
jgi:hypothetical protein